MVGTACRASASKPRRQARTSVLGSAQNLAAGAIHLPRGCEIDPPGTQKRLRFWEQAVSLFFQFVKGQRIITALGLNHGRDGFCGGVRGGSRPPRVKSNALY